MEYFKNETVEAAKAKYRKLATENHPDVGGDLETMKDINSQYAEFLSSNSAKSAKAYRQKGRDENWANPAHEDIDLDDVAEHIRQRIEELLNSDMDFEVELAGLWIWVKAEFGEPSDLLYSLGFKWAKGKKLFYYAGVPSRNRKRMSINQIRELHGSQKFVKSTKEERAQIGA